VRRGWVLVVVFLLAACTSTPATETTRPRPASTPSLAPGFPAQPDGVPFPTKSWPEGEWPSGVDKAVVDEAVDTAFAGGDEIRVRAVVIVHGGEVIYERYSPNPLDGPTKVMPSFSMAKSFTSALVGILVKQDRIDVDELAPVPEWSAAGDPRGDITIDDLLHMSSGLEWIDGSDRLDSDLVASVTSGDAAGYAADKELAHEPGTKFNYSGGDTMLLDRIMAEEVDGNFRSYMDTELLEVLGISPLHAEFDEAGTWLGAYAADTTALNFAKFGLLYLRDGVWDGERILPEGWVDYTRTPGDTNPEYGRTGGSTSNDRRCSTRWASTGKSSPSIRSTT
jgi:CubicO group peptidase (beta-lactamase class C family)